MSDTVKETVAKNESLVREEILLPSLGLMYKGKQPDGKVTILPLRFPQRVLLMSETSDKLRRVNQVIQQCLEGLNIPFDDLLIADRFYIMMKIRVFTYGTEYRVQIPCPWCGKEFLTSIDLAKDLVVTELETGQSPEPYTVVHPVSGKTVAIRYLRVRDELDIQDYRDEAYTSKRAPAYDPMYAMTLAKEIVSIDNDVFQKMNDAGRWIHEPGALARILGMIDGTVGNDGPWHARDTDAIEFATAEHAFGISIFVSTKCKYPDCGKKIEGPLPMSPDFFRPGTLEHRSRETS